MIRAILVDDEPLALDRLSKLLHESKLVEVVGTFVHPSDALAAIPALRADAFFLDIEMPGTDGLSLADQILDMDTGVEIVFVTAYNEYAIEAFELNALDYLLKPVRRERLQKTLERIVKAQRREEKQHKIQVECLGGFRILPASDSVGEFKWRTAKAAELLAFLIHYRGRAVSRQTILDTLWDYLDADRAAAHFHTTIHYLRKNVGKIGFEELIYHGNGFYWVDANRIDCDYYEFERLASGEMDDSRQAKLSNRLVSLYKGGYLDGQSWPWAESTRIDLEEKYVTMLIQVQEKCIQEHDIPSAIKILKTILKFVPVNEEVHAKLIHAHLMINDRVAAMKQYDVLKRRLKTEYGIEPSDTVKQLVNMKTR